MRRAIQHRTERQIELDQRTGSFALTLRALLISLENSYQRLDHYRSITLALCPATPTCPEALEAFKLAAQTEQALQTSIQVMWNEQRLQFLSDYPVYLFRPPAGTLTDLATDWTREFEIKTAKPFSLDAYDIGIKSQSTVRKQANEWTVAWTQ